MTEGTCRAGGITTDTVRAWRRRFLERRLDGLCDEPRPGVPRKITDADVERVIVKTLEETPEGGTVREIVIATVRSLLTTGVLIAAYYLLPLSSEFTPGTVIALVGGLVAVSLLLLWQARVVTRSPRPQLRAVEAVATALPLFLLLFAVVFYLLERSAPESSSEPLSRSDALYFTVTVFTTVGFGDISPRSEPARLLVTGQMTIDVVLIGVAAKLLVEAVQQGLRQRSRTGTEGENGG